MAAPRQMTAHTLELIKNAISNPHRVDFAAKLSPNVTIDPVFAGRVVHVNSVGEFEMGLPNVALACHMPIFLFYNSDDPVVKNDGGDPAVDGGVYQAVAPTGVMVGMVAIGSYELASTEFDAAQTYVPGDGLTATASNSNATTGGRITLGTAYAVPLCGVVSRGVRATMFFKQELCFWPVWLPRSA